MCRKYPGAHVKTVRSHMMKFLYKYFLKHPDLREQTAVTNSYEGFETIVAELKSRVRAEADSEYEEVRHNIFVITLDVSIAPSIILTDVTPFHYPSSLGMGGIGTPSMRTMSPRWGTRSSSTGRCWPWTRRRTSSGQPWMKMKVYLIV